MCVVIIALAAVGRPELSSSITARCRTPRLASTDAIYFRSSKILRVMNIFSLSARHNVGHGLALGILMSMRVRLSSGLSVFQLLTLLILLLCNLSALILPWTAHVGAAHGARYHTSLLPLPLKPFTEAIIVKDMVTANSL